MQVLFLSTWFPDPPDNGSKIRVYQLLRALAVAHDVTLLSFAFDEPKQEQGSLLLRFCGNIKTVPVDPFAANQTGSMRRFLSAEPVFTRPIPAMRQLVETVVAEKCFDVAIASTEIMANYAFQTPSSTVRILEEHNSLSRWMQERYLMQTGIFQKLRGWASWRKTQRYEARLFCKFNLITMVSEEDRTTSRSLSDGLGHVEVVPNGVDCQHNRPGLIERRPYRLIYNGALSYSANYEAMQHFLTGIYPLIKEEMPDVSLSITGSTSGINLAGLALDKSVILTGYVADIRYPVAEASVCVVPIRQGGGTRLKILEAMALGTPVVSTSKGAEGLNAVDGEHLLIADGREDFARRTVELLGDSALRSKLAANARRLVEQRYDWQKIGERFAALVEQAVDEHKSRPL